MQINWNYEIALQLLVSPHRDVQMKAVENV